MLLALVGLSFPAAACLGSSSPSNNGGDGGSSSGSGSGSGSSSGSGSGSSSGSDGSSGYMPVPLMPSGTGYVAMDTIGIVGAWYAYGDCWGANGAPPGDCETKGMHTEMQCSAITSPTPAGDAGAGFPPNGMGAMCLSGTAAQVIGNPADYSNIFGIGIGLDFNNMGGSKMPYDAASHKVVGFEFDVSGLPASPGQVRVEFPIPATDTSGDSWSYTLPAGSGHVQVLFSQLAPSFMTMNEPMFDPSKVESIQFHVVTVTTAAIPVMNLCVNNLAALVSM